MNCYNARVLLEMDTSFDFNSETPSGRDADSWSPTLQRYHQRLWSKPLPSGAPFDLVAEGGRGRYRLVHRSALGEFVLSSDAITNRLRKSAVARALDESTRPENLGYTIGSALLFPALCRDGKQTINQARGTHPRVKDRFDLTLVCIKRHYEDRSSPLEETLSRYADFFELFETFQGYVDFFLLQDLVDEDYEVAFFHEFQDFRTPAVPGTAEEYISYVNKSNNFIRARNRRISSWAAAPA